MADLEISVNIDATGTKAGAREVRSEIEQIKRSADSAARGLRGTLSSIDLKQLGRQLRDFGGQMREIGGAVSDVGRTMSLSLTAPLLAAGYALFQAGTNASALKNQLFAATGSMDAANKKLLELRDLARESAGVLSNQAVALYGFLKPLKLTDEAIDSMVKALGRLKLANDQLDVQQFTRNLTQLFTQSFERQDLKEAVGAFPRFGEILQAAFGLSSSDLSTAAEELKEMQRLGQLSLEQFMKGFADAVQKDQILSLLEDTVTTLLEKAMARIRIAFEPFGDSLVEVFMRIAAVAEPIITRIGNAFSGLSPEMQTIIVVAAAVVAALGPLLLIVGGIITAIGGMVAAIGTLVASAKIIGVAFAVLIGVILQIGPALAIAAAQLYVLYRAWESNWGGIRDATAEAAAAIKSAWNATLSALAGLTQGVLDQISEFWSTHGAEVMEAVGVIGEIVRTLLANLRVWWAENGDTVLGIVRAAWFAVRTVITEVVNIVLQTIRAVAAVIRGDWKALWDATVEILKAVGRMWLAVIVSYHAIIVNAVRAIFEGIFALHVWVVSEAQKLGLALVQGLIRGMLTLNPTSIAVGIIGNMISGMRAKAQTQSPSRVTMEIGRDIARGLALGIEEDAHVALMSAERMTSEALAKIEEIAKRQRDADERRRTATLRAEGSLAAGNLRDIEALQKEIDLLGVVSRVEKQRVENHYELIALRRQLEEQELHQDDIDRLVELRRQTQGHMVELAGMIDLYEQQQEHIKEHLQVQKEIGREAKQAAREAQQAYDEMYDSIRGHLEVLANEGFGGFFQNVYRRFQQFLRDLVAEWLTSKFFQLFFKGGNTAQAQASGQANGGIFGGILNGIFGGGVRGIGPGGTPTFAGGPGFGGLSGIFGGGRGGNVLLGGHEAAHAAGRRGGFGGLFGGGLAGTLTGVGAIGSVLGGAVGGRAGGFISNIGSGVAMGAQIGSIIPGIGTAIGAAVGGIVGFFSSLFGGSKARKADKRENLPALNQGFTDALQQLRDMIRDVRTLRLDPDSALTRAAELRQQIASGFGIQFQSKKYRKQAQTLIQQRTREADVLIEELRRVAEISRAAQERGRRIIPEFAGGVFMSRAFAEQFTQFKRINGMLPGIYRGIDTVPARLAPGEMVLNPMQQSRVRANAGGDPFAGAGIPGYAGGGMVQAPAPQELAPIEITLQTSIDAKGLFTVSARSPEGRRVLVDIQNEEFANDRIKLRRRGA